MNDVVKILFVEQIKGDIDLWLKAISSGDLANTYSIVATNNEFKDALISVIPDIIISDFELSKLSIRDTILIRNEISPHIPIIVIADLKNENLAAECVRNGSDDYVVKSHLSRLPFAIEASLTKQNAIWFRLNAEHELRNRKEQAYLLKRTIENISVALATVDTNNAIKIWNKPMAEMMGWGQKEVIGFPYSNFINIEYIGTNHEQVLSCLHDNGYWTGEAFIRNKSNKKLRALCRISALNGETPDNGEAVFEFHKFPVSGKQNGDIGLTQEDQDTVQQQSEIYPQNYTYDETEKNKINGCLDLVVKSMKMGMVSIDIATEKLSYDERACNLLGLDTSHYSGTREELQNIIHTDDRDETISLLKYAINRKKDYEAEFRTVWKDGSLHHMMTKARILYDEDKTPVRLNGLLWEVTDQKLLEIYLRENLRKVNSIINNLNGAIFRCKPDDNMTMEYISEGIKTISGYNSLDFLMNKVWSLVSIIATKDRKNVKKEIISALEHGCPYTVEYRIKTTTGGQKWVWMRGHGVYSGDTVIAHEGFISDISERKTVESRLNKSLKQLQQLNQYMQTVREKERMAISRELHDDLGQSLTAVKIDLGTLKKKIDNRDEALSRIDKISTLVTETIKTVQNITSHLRPQIINDLGLVSAIEWYSKDFSDRTGIAIYLQLDPVMEMSDDVSLTLFRILQESLTNIARHSRATKAEVRLKVHDSNLVMDIKDNGSGISEYDRKSHKSFGLISMMERAKNLGGELRILAPEKGGTSVHLKIPFKKKNKYEDSDL